METKLLWEQIVNKLSKEKLIDQDILEEYIITSELIKLSDKEFVVLVRSNLGVTILNEFKEVFIYEFKTLLNDYVSIEFSTRKVFDKNNKKESKREKLNVSLPENSLTFDNFIVGSSNKQANLAAKSVVTNPGSSFNPLFIYGDSGLGKTHLLQAIKNQAILTNKKVLYFTSEEFTKKVVNALNKGDLTEIEELKSEINSNDFFILDDVQFLSKKDKTNEFFFNIINNFTENGKQLVFSSDKTPELLNGFDKRMITRFNSGLSTPINSLDIPTAKLIIEWEIKKQGLKQKVNEDAVVYLAQNFSDDVRKIKGLVNRLLFFGIQNDLGHVIDLDDVVDLFKDTPSANLGLLNVKKIKEVVGKKYDVTLKAIDGKARTTAIKNARHLSMYFAKIILNHTSTQIGAEFGGRDHSTVLSAISRIEKLIYKEKEFKKIVESLKNEIIGK
ncbi:chromosomal replication initiator protein DnaA [Mesoplasma coleopterae]|uniref:Chromosomal replication initiator protein DnaA n=1 Tax=Mesoplasma coleopterae TaxID=324078 RepID=A0A2K8P1Y0_9MOLU|nr:chromosomal replication initiator protein DnaA [Mesoplasma coleopterae]ATZ20518.1 chromosomal replication initiator protein DnaA [Mesoplasma coleopterae]AVN62699.1 chromosomal replication initiator protein DnaA [Mesoplasma coleopterae]